MKRITKDELLAILKSNKQNHLNFAIEIENTIGTKNCIFTFKDAFEPNTNSNEKSDNSDLSEFMSVFVDSLEFPCETHISVNAISDEFIEECAEKIYQEISDRREQEVKLVLHGSDKIKHLIEKKHKEIKFLDFFDFTDNGASNSYYFDSNIKADIPEDLKIRMLDEYDEFFCETFTSDTEDDYLSAIFDYSIRNPKYADCGIIGCFGIGEELLGYLAYYGLDETIRDISYIYISEICRNNGYGKALLNFFKNKNIDDNKISYFSYPENEYSEKLAKSCEFLPCSHRYEFDLEFVV